MRFRRRPAPPPVAADHEHRSELAAALLFTTVPSDRALAGWAATEWAAVELEQLGVIAVTRDAG